MFGESVSYMPLDARVNEQTHAENELESGTWLGANARIEGNVVGIEHGIVK